MAQASSAQREPSMEEILASIRRIIEDNESGRQEEGPETAPDAIGDAAADTDAFRAELKVANTQSPPAEAAEKAPEPGRASEYPEPSRRSEPNSDTLEQPTGGGAGRFIPGSEAQSGEADADVASFSADSNEDEHVQEVDKEHGSPSHSRPLTVGSPDALRSAPTPGREGPQTMLSEASGRKVAAAFEELSDALEATRRKNLTEAAEEMLRPMLQEWLDNNLPQLVERLVREEIERIARGG